MVSTASVRTYDWLQAGLALLGYGILFAQTIRQSGKNRPVILGVCAVVMFSGFLIAAGLSERRYPQIVIWFGTILLGIAILCSVAPDGIRWLHGEELPHSETKSDLTASTAEPK